ncbi:PadR family transcriptional regulator [Streptosporangium saharense]|uniref:PadR family transcriptional regulator n=1 Tax=Streptosporangium saharense TaxID=1706840 RepID=UPI003324FA75
MTSTLGYAILTALARRPRSGYELATTMGHPLGCFWTARHSQIHPELQRLVAAELVTFEQVPGPGPQRKKIYSITRRGTKALREWVVEPPQARPERDELLLKSYAAWLADPAELVKLFQVQLEEHERRLAAYEDERSSFAKAPGRESRRFGDYATLWYGISYENHRIAWCHWMIDQLTRSRRPSPVPQLTTDLCPSQESQFGLSEAQLNASLCPSLEPRFSVPLGPQFSASLYPSCEATNPSES